MSLKHLYLERFVLEAFSRVNILFLKEDDIVIGALALNVSSINL